MLMKQLTGGTVGGGGITGGSVYSNQIYYTSVMQDAFSFHFDGSAKMNLTPQYNPSSWTSIAYPIEVTINGTTTTYTHGSYTTPLAIDCPANSDVSVKFNTNGNQQYARLKLDFV